MKKTKTIVLLGILSAVLFNCASPDRTTRRVVDDFNFNWKFARGEQPKAHEVFYDDSNWRDIRLPHDWSVEESFTQTHTAGATAFLPGGIGWYRKTFHMAAADSGMQTRILFDGVYSNSQVWINGHLLGERPYGYIPFYYDLTPYLHYGEKENIIAVRADRSAYADCRWYPGSGIYRHVKLITTHPVHIAQWGHFVTTPVIESEFADVLIQSTVQNETNQPQQLILKSVILDAENQPCDTVQTACSFIPGEEKRIEQHLQIQNSKLWDVDAPHLYAARTVIMQDDGILDDVKTTFGVRQIQYDAETGFSLNGRNLKFKGVCLHHDGGLVGAAVPIGVWERRLRTLKMAGVNAIRTAHNPPAEDFLDLCDRMGFLVQDEAFDEWNNPKDKRHNYNQQKVEDVTRGYTQHFDKWSEADIKNMVLRDRNHPSIVMWSIGNEIEWTYPRYGAATGYWVDENEVDYYFDEPPYPVEQIKENFYNAKPGKYQLAPTAKKLSQWIKEVDTTRPVTANLVIPSVSSFSGYADALDIIGYSYRQSVYDYGHRHYPDKMIVGTENWTQWHEWKPVLERDFIPGIFLWTGINYMGESGRWPIRGSGSGLLDFAGFKKPGYYMFKALWSDDPSVYITTQEIQKSVYRWDDEARQLVEKRPGAWKRKLWGWHPVEEHWNYTDGDSIVVEVYTNCPEVELFINDQSAGVNQLADYEDHIVKWVVPYEKGQVKAVGSLNGKDVEYVIHTAGQAASIELTADKKMLQSDRYDVVHVEAQLVDNEQHPVLTKNETIYFQIEGDCRLLGVDNGSTTNVQNYQAGHCKTDRGRCLLILQANDSPGEVQVRAVAGNVTSQPAIIAIK